MVINGTDRMFVLLSVAMLLAFIPVIGVTCDATLSSLPCNVTHATLELVPGTYQFGNSIRLENATLDLNSSIINITDTGFYLLSDINVTNGKIQLGQDTFDSIFVTDATQLSFENLIIDSNFLSNYFIQDDGSTNFTFRNFTGALRGMSFSYGFGTPINYKIYDSEINSSQISLYGPSVIYDSIINTTLFHSLPSNPVNLSIDIQNSSFLSGVFQRQDGENTTFIYGNNITNTLTIDAENYSYVNITANNFLTSQTHYIISNDAFNVSGNNYTGTSCYDDDNDTICDDPLLVGNNTAEVWDISALVNVKISDTGVSPYVVSYSVSSASVESGESILFTVIQQDNGSAVSAPQIGINDTNGIITYYTLSFIGGTNAINQSSNWAVSIGLPIGTYVWKYINMSDINDQISSKIITQSVTVTAVETAGSDSSGSGGSSSPGGVIPGEIIGDVIREVPANFEVSPKVTKVRMKSGSIKVREWNIENTGEIPLTLTIIQDLANSTPTTLDWIVFEEDGPSMVKNFKLGTGGGLESDDRFLTYLIQVPEGIVEGNYVIEYDFIDDKNQLRQSAIVNIEIYEGLSLDTIDKVGIGSAIGLILLIIIIYRWRTTK